VTPELFALAAERLGAEAEGVLARLAGGRARALTKHERAALLVGARSPVPPGLRMIHPTWIEAALEGLPARARAALDGATTPTDVWLGRWVTAELPPMTNPDVPLERAWLLGIGADQLAFALGAHARQLPQLAAAHARIAKPPRAGHLGPQRAAIERARGLSLDDDRTVIRVACRALAPHLATNRLAQLQLSRAWDIASGRIIEHELAASADVSLDQVPAWAALVAP
jgi:hypothetical protein